GRGGAPRRPGGAPPLHHRGGIRARRRPARDARARWPGRPGRRRARSAACAARRGGRCAGAPDARCRRARVADVRAFATLRYEKRGAVAVVTLDRPEVLNAYDVAMRDDLYAALAAADEAPEVRALVLAGRGPAFSTGGDVREFGTAPSPFIARAVRWRRDVWGRRSRSPAAGRASIRPRSRPRAAPCAARTTSRSRPASPLSGDSRSRYKAGRERGLLPLHPGGHRARAGGAGVRGRPLHLRRD